MGGILKKAGHFLLGYHGINIHQRLMRLVLFAILSFFAAIALFFMVGENFFRQDISRIDSEFARENSEYTKEVIEKTSMATLAKLAVADAWSINRELDLMRHDADVLAKAMTLIMTQPENYHPHSVRDPYEGKVPPGDTLLLYTDGVSEAMDEADNLFKESRIKEELNALPPDQKVEDILSKLLEKVRQHAGGAEQSDDITMLGLRYNGKE